MRAVQRRIAYRLAKHGRADGAVPADSAESSMMGAPPKLDLDWLLEVLAERVAVKIRAEFTQDGASDAPVKPRLLTVEQAAVYIGRSKEAVQHMVSSGKVPTVRSDRRVFIDVEDLNQWILEHKQAGM